MKRLASMIIIAMLCIGCFVCMSIAEDMPSVSISVDKASVTVKNGDSITVTVHVDAPDGEDTTISGSYDNKYICSATISKHIGNDTELTITGTGMGVGVVTVFVEGHPEVTTDITVNVKMSAEEKEMINKVKYLSDRSFIYYDDADSYVLLFSLKDANETRIAAPSKVDIRIENDKGVIVYKKTHYLTPHNFSTWTSTFYGERYLASVYIDPADIMEGESSSGNVYFTVTNGNYYFDESKVSASDLPKIDLTNACSLTTSSVPVTLTYSSSSGRVYSKVHIANLTYDFTESHDGTVCLTLYFTGEKTYDSEGDGNSSSCRIGWKLYDEEGYVIETGTCNTSSLETGEKFKNCEEKIYSLEPGKYSLKLMDVN